MVVLGVLLLILVGVAVLYAWMNKTNGKIESGGETREYLLYVPETYDPATPAPLVISMHGHGGWPAQQQKLSGWNALADEFGFIVVYPAGIGSPKHWRTSSGAGEKNDPAMDVAFINDLIDKLASEYTLDPDRIYASGMSNGGGMTFVLSCQLADRIAAIGTVSGAYLLSWDDCAPTRLVPVIAFHGTADPIVPYEGGPSEAYDLPFPSIPEWIATLAQRRQCATPQVERPDHGSVVGVRYTQCAENADVVFYTVHGGGHSWPGGDTLPESIVGPTTQDVNATRLIWEFFQAHPKK